MNFDWFIKEWLLMCMKSPIYIFDLILFSFSDSLFTFWSVGCNGKRWNFWNWHGRVSAAFKMWSFISFDLRWEKNRIQMRRRAVLYHRSSKSFVRFIIIAVRKFNIAYIIVIIFSFVWSIVYTQWCYTSRWECRAGHSIHYAPKWTWISYL